MKFRFSIHLLITFCIFNSIQSSNLIKPILKGRLAKPKQFPYAASLTIDFWRLTFRCGGALISQRWILTAAHCVVFERGFLAESVDVKLGYTNLHDPTHGVDTIVDHNSIFVHEDYLRKQVDLAALKLPDNVEFTDYIRPITLPKITEPYSSYEGEYAVVMGWGLTESELPNSLRFKRAFILSDAQCEQRSGNFVYLKHVICINPYTDSICDGDSGSPLVLENQQFDVLIGISVFTFSAECDEGKPAGLTRITLFLDWIRSTTGVVYL